MTCATVVDSDCDSLGCELVSDLGVVGIGCHVDNERWSDDDCALERTVTCTDSTTGNVTRTVAVTHQVTQGGSLIEGTMRMDSTTNSGTYICSGTYDISYERVED